MSHVSRSPKENKLPINSTRSTLEICSLIHKPPKKTIATCHYLIVQEYRSLEAAPVAANMAGKSRRRDKTAGAKPDKLRRISSATPPPASSPLPESMASTISPSLITPTRKLLIASLGNPGNLQNTLHSAGHHVLDTLRSYLSYPPFEVSRAHASAPVSRGEDALLYQSPSFMNTSGPALATAWRTFLRDLPDREARDAARLVIVHDELELELGKVRLREPMASFKGHNGLKSVAGTGAGAGPNGGSAKFWRVAVGIGRPESREPKVVADYVLRKMTPIEKERIADSVDQVAQTLEKMRDGK